MVAQCGEDIAGRGSFSDLPLGSGVWIQVISRQEDVKGLEWDIRERIHK